MGLVHTKKGLHPMWYEQKKSVHDHTMFVWFMPSKSYSHPKMFFFMLTRFFFTPFKFCSHIKILFTP